MINAKLGLISAMGGDRGIAQNGFFYYNGKFSFSSDSFPLFIGDQRDTWGLRRLFF